jgi:hypothetical protein
MSFFYPHHFPCSLLGGEPSHYQSWICSHEIYGWGDRYIINRGFVFVIGRGDPALTTTTTCQFRNILIFFSRDMVSMPFLSISFFVFNMGGETVTLLIVGLCLLLGGEREVIGRGDPALTFNLYSIGIIFSMNSKRF